jgi:hypothetical protein
MRLVFIADLYLISRKFQWVVSLSRKRFRKRRRHVSQRARDRAGHARAMIACRRSGRALQRFEVPQIKIMPFEMAEAARLAVGFEIRTMGAWRSSWKKRWRV